MLLAAALWSGTSFAASSEGGAGVTDGAELALAALGPLDSLRLRADDLLHWSVRPATYETYPGAGGDALLASSPLSSPAWLSADGNSSLLSPLTLKLPLQAAPAPVSTRYDSHHNNMLVDMSWWHVGDSSLRMLYGDHLQSQAASSANPADQQVGLDLNLALGDGLFHARTSRALAAPDSGQFSVTDLTSLQYGYAANLGKIRYGADYVHAGSAYNQIFEADGPTPQPNDATTTLWTRVPLTSRFSLQASKQQLRKALAGTPGKPSYVDDLTGLKAHFVLLAQRPYMGSSLWYEEGLRNTQYVSEGSMPGDGNVRSSGAAFQVSNAWGSHSFATSQTVAYDATTGGLNQSLSQSLSSTVYPYNWFSLGLSATASEDTTQTGSSLWLGTYKSEAMWASYTPPQRHLTLTWSGSAHGYSTLDKSSDYSQTYENFTVKFDRFSLLGASMPLALTLQFSTYSDQVYSTQNTNDVALWLQFGRGELASRIARLRPYLADLPGTYY